MRVWGVRCHCLWESQMLRGDRELFLGVVSRLPMGRLLRGGLERGRGGSEAVTEVQGKNEGDGSGV